MLILTGIYGIGFAISGVPWWFAVAVVCGLLNVIPIVGAVIALLIVLPVTWLVSQETMPVLGALITYVVAQALEGFYLTPKIMGAAARVVALGCVSSDPRRRLRVRAAGRRLCSSDHGSARGLVAAQPPCECAGLKARPWLFQGRPRWSNRHSMVCIESGQRCVVILSNDVRSSGGIPDLVKLIIGETGVPYGWEYGDRAGKS